MKRFNIRRPREPNVETPEDDEKEKAGLHELWPGRADAAAKIETKLDIVAVHGLNGDLYKTWTEGDRIWLQDFLPESIPEARIFTFGYNAKIAFSGSLSKIDDFAKSLLERLKARRRDFPDTRRPIIFICHSLGGLVFKKAMIIAHERSDRYETLSRDVYGVMFMGTPHRGSDVAFWSKFFRSFANTLTLGNIRTSLLKDLEPKSETLSAISSAFVERGKRLQKIFSFYEQRGIGGFLIVEPQSAILQLPNEVAIPLDADHRSMCRFATPNSERYLVVFDALRELVDDSLEVNQSYTTSDRTAFIQSLGCIKSNRILRQISSPYEGTCTWFSSHPKYQDWRTGHESKVLWVWGAAGIGKTVMMKHIIQRFGEERKRFPYDKELTAFFFCDDKDWLRSGHKYVAISLLDQILAQDFELIRYIDAGDIREYVSLLQSYSRSYDMSDDFEAIIWRAITCILHRSRNTSFWFFLDALDELESQSRRKILDQLSSMIGEDLENRLHIVFSDRVGPHARSFGLQALVYELGAIDAEQDVRRYISGQCKRFGLEQGLSKTAQLSIETTLLAVANGNFLHAILAWANFHKGVSLWSTAKIEKRLSMVRKISSDAVSYYCSLLQKIPQDVMAISKRAFTWVIGTRRALSVKELQHAIALNSKQSSLLDLDKAKATAFEREFEETFAYLLRRDYDGYVHLAHQTVKEILISEPGSFSIGNEAILKHFRIDNEILHLEIARGCLTLLSFKDFTQGSLQQSIEKMIEILSDDVRHLQYRDSSETQEEIDDPDANLLKEMEEKRLEETGQVVQDSMRAKQFALVFYATCYFNVHFAPCSSDRVAVKLFAKFLRTWQAHPFYMIATSLRLIPIPRSSYFPDVPIERRKPPIHFSIQLGDYPEVIKILVESGEDLNAADSNNWTPLMYAIANKRLDSVKYLLTRHETILSRHPKATEGPVHIACHKRSSREILELIINDHRTDINEKNMHGSTPARLLFGVAEFKNLSIELLNREDLNIFSRNNDLQTYLDQCFFNGTDEDFVITILSRPDVEIQTLRQRPQGLGKWTFSPTLQGNPSYILLASQWRWHRVETLILRHDPKQVLQPGENGMSLLETYAFYGTEWRLQELLEELPADIYQRYAAQNSRLLHLCARQNWEPLALLLQKKFGLNIIEADEHGRTILFYASEFEWNSITKLSEGRSLEQINHQSRDGKTALIVAVEIKNAVAVEALLQAGADVLIQDNRGRTAAHAAAEHGHRFILKLLLQKPFREHGRDFQKRSLLHYLVMWESEEFITKYINKFRPIINIFDNRRRTPLIYAAMHRNTLAGEALLRSGADPRLKDASGSTAMHYALSEGLLDFTKLLWEHAVPMGELDGFGRSALHLALRSKNLELIEFIINLIIEQKERRMADPRRVRSEFDLSYMIILGDVFGQTVIHRACLLEDRTPLVSTVEFDDDKHDIEKSKVVEQCISGLRTLGADINQQDRYKAAPLHLAVKSNNRPAVEALLSFPDIEVNVSDNLECTALDWSVAQDQPRITTLLRQHGARHSIGFRRKLNAPLLKTRTEAEYDPKLWAIVHIGAASKNEENRRSSTSKQ